MISQYYFIITKPMISFLVSLLLWCNVVTAFTITHRQQYRPTTTTMMMLQQQQSQNQLSFSSSSAASRVTKTIGGVSVFSHSRMVVYAGGFEWDDPTDMFDQGVENPYKNTNLLEDGNNENGELKIDPARLLSPRMNGSNIYLIGMMGSGKSSIGKIVAKRMGSYTFLDTDEIIEKVTSMSIPEIFQTEGEDAFRDVEAQVLDSVHPYVRCVISTGGGIVSRIENWSKLQTGLVVWLDVPPEIIYERIQGTDRPLLQTNDPLQTLRDLLQTRKEKYENADVRIEVTNDMDETMVADTMIRALHNFIDDHPPAWLLAKQKAQADGLDWVK